MTIIVTGGAGFIGSCLVGRLLAEGQKVLVIDSLWTGSIANVNKFKDHPNYRFVNWDVRNKYPIRETPKQIYHLACPASPDHFGESPIEILETCFRGTQNSLDLAVSCNARVLIASTSEIYGDPRVIPQSEEYWGNTNSFGPRACYDEGKRITEALAYGYQQKHNLEVRIARIFNAYGPSMQLRDGRAVPNFIAAAMEGRPITIYGDGSAGRCFQYVTDCVDGLMSLMQSGYTRPVNIGTNLETTVEDLARMITALVAEKMGSTRKVPIQFLPARTDDPYRRKPDITLAKEVLGWQPSVALRDGLEKTVDWFLQDSGQIGAEEVIDEQGIMPLKQPSVSVA
ncbi:unnamed protein product, partial [Clonostachys solani]